jgi:hypothetical protein
MTEHGSRLRDLSPFVISHNGFACSRHSRSLARLGPRNCDGQPLNVNDWPQSSIDAMGGPSCGLPVGDASQDPGTSFFDLDPYE